VAREGQEVDPEGVHVDRDLADGLHPIHVERDLHLAGDAPDLAHGLDGARLGVRVHQRDEDGVRPNGAAHVLGVDHPVAIDGQIGRLESVLLEVLARAQDRVVLDLRGDDVAAAPRMRDALDRHVVGLGAAGGKDDLLFLDLQKARDLLARRLHAVARLAAKAVDARWIAEALPEIREHRLDHVRMHWGRRIVIEIDLAVH
jgi:hypothetical protein